MPSSWFMMARQGACLNFFVLGAFTALLLGYVQAEKPDTMRILTRHHQYRSLLQAADMIKMTWNTSLEKLAASVVDKCLSSVESVRSLPELRHFGANFGSAPYPTPMRNGYPEDIQTSIIDQWGSERASHKLEGGCPTQPCDSWWQMVWSNASQIGCSLKVCGNSTIMVCIYNSRANTETDHPYKPGQNCTACPAGFRKCELNMCAPERETPVEPDFLPGFHDSIDNDGSEDDKEETTNNDNYVRQPYAGASGSSGYVEESNVSDSSSRLAVPFTTSACLLLLGTFA